MSKYKPAPFVEPTRPLPLRLLPKNDGTMAVVTADLVYAIRSKAGGWNRHQLEALGVEWPPQNGWLASFSEGKELPLKQWEIAVANSNRTNIYETK